MIVFVQQLFSHGSQLRSQVAFSNLGICYEFGDGVTQDYQEAQRLYALASAHGHAKTTEDLTALDEKIRNECPLLGKQVVITGTSREDLNGRAGVATTFDHARGRYVVELMGSSEGQSEKERLKLKPGNLARVSTKTGTKKQGKKKGR